MALKVFEKFKQTSIINNTFSRLFYENMHLSQTTPTVFYLKIHKDMCSTHKTADHASIVSALDGITAISLLAQYNLSGFSASISLTTQFFEDCYEDDEISIVPLVKSFDSHTNIGLVSGTVHKGQALIAECSHTMFFLGEKT